MAWLDGMRRKKKTRVREDVWDAPTLFGGPGSHAAQTEKTISVLSAAGGKPTSPARRRHLARVSLGSARTVVVALSLGAIAFAGAWQSGMVDATTVATLASRIEGWRGMESSGNASNAGMVRVQSGPITAARGVATTRIDDRAKNDAALIERVVLTPATMGYAAPAPSAVPDSADDAALPSLAPPGSPRQTSSAVRPARVGIAVQSPDHTPSNAPSAAAGSTRVREGEVKPQNRSDQRVQVARSKEPDPDTRLLEALLIHLRKTESPQGAGR